MRNDDPWDRFFYPTITLMICSYILKPSSNRSPYILTLVQKVKHRVYKIHAFLNEAIPRLCKLFQLEMTCTSCNTMYLSPTSNRLTLYQRSHCAQGVLSFFFIHRLWSSIYRLPPKISEFFQQPKKIFQYLAIQKNTPILYLEPKKRP